MDLVVVVVRFKHGDDLLPVGIENVAVVASETLRYLPFVLATVVRCADCLRYAPTFAQCPLNVSGGGAWPAPAMFALAPKCPPCCESYSGMPFLPSYFFGAAAGGGCTGLYACILGICAP